MTNKDKLETAAKHIEDHKSSPQPSPLADLDHENHSIEHRMAIGMPRIAIVPEAPLLAELPSVKPPHIIPEQKKPAVDDKASSSPKKSSGKLSLEEFHAFFPKKRKKNKRNASRGKSEDKSIDLRDPKNWPSLPDPLPIYQPSENDHEDAASKPSYLSMLEAQAIDIPAHNDIDSSNNQQKKQRKNKKRQEKDKEKEKEKERREREAAFKAQHAEEQKKKTERWESHHNLQLSVESPEAHDMQAATAFAVPGHSAQKKSESNLQKKFQSSHALSKHRARKTEQRKKKKKAENKNSPAAIPKDRVSQDPHLPEPEIQLGDSDSDSDDNTVEKQAQFINPVEAMQTLTSLLTPSTRLPLNPDDIGENPFEAKLPSKAEDKHSSESQSALSVAEIIQKTIDYLNKKPFHSANALASAQVLAAAITRLESVMSKADNDIQHYSETLGHLSCWCVKLNNLYLLFHKFSALLGQLDNLKQKHMAGKITDEALEHEMLGKRNILIGMKNAILTGILPPTAVVEFLPANIKKPLPLFAPLEKIFLDYRGKAIGASNRQLQLLEYWIGQCNRILDKLAQKKVWLQSRQAPADLKRKNSPASASCRFLGKPKSESSSSSLSSPEAKKMPDDSDGEEPLNENMNNLLEAKQRIAGGMFKNKRPEEVAQIIVDYFRDKSTAHDSLTTLDFLHAAIARLKSIPSAANAQQYTWLLSRLNDWCSQLNAAYAAGKQLVENITNILRVSKEGNGLTSEDISREIAVIQSNLAAINERFGRIHKGTTLEFKQLKIEESLPWAKQLKELAEDYRSKTAKFCKEQPTLITDWATISRQVLKIKTAPQPTPPDSKSKGAAVPPDARVRFINPLSSATQEAMDKTLAKLVALQEISSSSDDENDDSLTPG